MSTAIIAGGSVAGLTAAQAIAGSYDKVLVIEADSRPQSVGPRKGVPQGRHTHGLLKGGSDALTELFPNLPEQLKSKGAPSADFCQDVKWYLNKRWMLDFEGGLPIHFQTRPLLEECIRENVEKLENVEIRYRSRYQDFLFDPSSNRITGVRIKSSEGDLEDIAADLVIDAMGRGTPLPKWLSSHGFGDVPVSETRVDLGYASCLLKLPTDPARKWTSLLIYPTGPDEIKGCTLVRVENDTWLLTLAGYHNDHPPSDQAGFLEFAKNLPKPDVYEAIKEAEFVTEISLHKFPSSIRRHYDRMDNFPDGIIPVGDSNVSLNPLFGQGMTVAFMSVRDLSLLFTDAGGTDSAAIREIRTKFFKRINKIFSTPWDLAMGQDFRYPATVGIPPFGYQIKNILKGMILSSVSKSIIKRFYKVVHLVEEEKSFYHPARVLQVVFTMRSRGKG
ncbi:hypothetical protein GUA87_05765 [Sneathiella sp. P13V-1]|uniref:FAD-dependent oxidoreductase n=1 Tax=Sneathiella sp. P13V-1 TaxID=2697366 RepID=UPI00187B4BCB|nr:hypothetical protein [Sneathiella sp. P13V-1]MBE7636343.1 hypothetical protein [Sneathiella sp. P13V-1]